jgi:hypothetical protein
VSALKNETAIYTVKGLKDDQIRMIGSSDMIRRIYKLSHSAEQRIVNEMCCILYGNGKQEDIKVDYLAEAWQILGESNNG